MKQMEEALARTVEFLRRPDLRWECQAATDVHDLYPNAVQYSAKHEDVSLKVVSGSAKNGDRFIMGMVSLTGSDDSPVIMNLPAELADQATRIALQAILNRN